MKQKLTFIVNPISGTHNKDAIIRLIPEIIDTSKYEWRLKYTEYAGHAEKLAADAVAHNADVVVAIGGDGTVNEIARQLINTDCALGIVPCGSGNGLGRHLQVPMDAEGALKVINNGKTILADHGTINGHPFFCTCGMGFDAYVSERFAVAGKRGMWTYLEQMVQIARNYRSEQYSFEIDGEKLDMKAFVVACGNASQYGNNVFIAPEASIQDGLLDMIVMEPFKKINAAQVMFQMMNQTITQRDDVHRFVCKNVVVHRQSPGFVHCDGEPLMESADVDICIHPHTIRMICGEKELYNGNPISNVFKELSGKIGSDIKENNRRIMRINKEMLGLLKR